MHITYRPMRLTDIDDYACLPLLDEAAYDPPTRRRLPLLWREMLTTGFAEAIVLEDSDRPPAQRLVGYAICGFLRDGWLRDFLAAPTPYINRRLVDDWQAGRAPFLTRPEMPRANAGPGVDLHTFSEGAPPFTALLGQAVFEKSVEAFLSLVRGYQVRQTTIEVYGETQYAWNINGGFHLHTDYQAFYDTRPSAQPGPHERPFLIGLTRAEAQAAPGSTVAMIFSFTPPRLGFKPAEQDLLLLALQDLTDEHAAAELSVALVTVRKRWLSIYAQAEKRLPGLLPEDTGDGTRGAEKRRRLLGFLRSHPEDLRPYSDKTLPCVL